MPNVKTHTLIDGLTGFWLLQTALCCSGRAALSTLASKNAFALASSPFMTLSFSGQFHWQLFVLRGAALGAVPLPAAALPLAAPAVPLAAMPL